jgi:hypothetical protein
MIYDEMFDFVFNNRCEDIARDRSIFLFLAVEFDQRDVVASGSGLLDTRYDLLC